MDLLTYYKDEEQHPRLIEARQWYKDEVLTLLLPAWHGEVILAGGALRSFFTGGKVRDFDLYGSEDFLKMVKNGDRSIFGDHYAWRWKRISESKDSYVYRLVTYDPEIQDLRNTTFNIIKGARTDPAEIIDKYDLTVCMCAITHDRIVHHPDYFLDLVAKTIRIHSLEDPVGILWRIQKYNRLGFEISKAELWRVVEALHDLEKIPTLYKREETPIEEQAHTLEEIFRSS